MSTQPTLAIAGATGFIGRALVEALRTRAHVIALGRALAPGTSGGVVYRRCDLFSLKDAEDALQGAQIAVYLVHSMLPSARLTQGTFSDFDLICADNFARAAAHNGVRKIVYLGGLLPRERANLSDHLASRREVEHALAAYGAEVITVRAGMVIGAGGSSLRMLLRLVERLPAMITPRWTRSNVQPVSLRDVVDTLAYAALHDAVPAGAYDVGMDEVLTYASMLRRTAALLGRKLPMIPFPLPVNALSMLWVSAITGSPPDLVLPLVHSLKHEMVARDGRVLMQRAGITPQGFDEAMREAIAHEHAPPRANPNAHAEPKTQPSSTKDTASAPTVRSVQRLPLGAGRTAEWAANEYMRWLDRVAQPLVHVEVRGRNARFQLRGIPLSLIELTFAPDRSRPDRQLFYVTGGALSRVFEGGRARLEFRETLGGDALLAAIHDFTPRLPWRVYLATQAIAHLLVMGQFGRHLARTQRRASTVPASAPHEPARAGT